MVENTVERETQPGPRKKRTSLEQHAGEMQSLIAAARQIVGGNDGDAADLIVATASCVKRAPR